MSQVHGWKSMSAWRKHRAEKYRTGRGLIKAGESFVHVEGLGSLREARAEECVDEKGETLEHYKTEKV